MPSFFDFRRSALLGLLFCFLFFHEGNGQTLYNHFRLDFPNADILQAPNYDEQIGSVGTTRDRFGKEIAAILLNGNGGFMHDVGFLQSLTASVWFKSSGIGPGNKVIFGHSHCLGNLPFYGIGLTNDQLYFTWGNPSANSVLNTPAPSVNQWHMATATYDGQLARLYLDGIQVAVSPDSTGGIGSHFTNKFTIGFGYENCQPAHFFDGAIDDIKLYSGVMSDAQILAQFQEGGSAPDPILKLDLDGNATSYPYNPTTNSGAVPAADRFNWASGAMKFDGVNDFISVNPFHPFDNYKEVSVAAWIKLDGNTTEPKAIVSSDDTNKFVHFQAASFPTEMSVFVNPTAVINLPVPAITPGEWVHLALIAKSGSQKVYINGEVVSSANQVFTSIANANLLRIGSGLLNGRFFKGWIDQVTLYDRALTPEQVRYDKTIYDRIAHYPFSNNANDLELGNNGTVTGGSFVEDRFGNPNSACRTNGSPGTIQIPHSMHYEWMWGFSVSYWVKISSPPGYFYIVKGTSASYPGDTSRTFYSFVDPSDISTGVCGQSYDFPGVGSSFPPWYHSDNHWHHVVGTFNGNRTKLYIDGIFHDGSDHDYFLNYLNNNKKPIRIGSGTTSVDFDDVQIFRRALSPGEIQELFSPASCNLPVPTISIVGNLTFCQGDSVTLTSSEANGNLWNTGDTTQSIVVKLKGNYSVRTRTETCISGISEPVTVVVNQIPAQPVVAASGPLTFCQGGSVTLSTNAVGGHRWSNGSTSQSITVTTSGTFADTAKATGCQTISVSDPVTVIVNPLPVVNAGADVTILLGDSTFLTATGASSYQWSPLTGISPSSGNTATIKAMPTQTTLYTVSGRDSNLCSATDNVLVTVTGTTRSLPEVIVASSKRNIRVFPNPSSSGRFHIQLPENADNRIQFTVFSMDGKMIWSGSPAGKPDLEIDLSSRPSGLYLLKFNNGTSVKTIRLSKF